MSCDARFCDARFCDARACRPRSIERRHRLREASRGFTMIELMAAIAAGIFVATAVFAMAKGATHFYHRETRLANATLAAMVGFERLQSDISRASFLTTPNYALDPSVCRTGSGWATGSTQLQGIQIGTPINTYNLQVLNGFTPQRVTLTGSFGSIEKYAVDRVLLESGVLRVYLDPNSAAIDRTLGPDSGDLASYEPLEGIFLPGRVLRIVDDAGRQHFGRITGFDAQPGDPAANPFVSVSTTNPTITYRPVDPLTPCALSEGDTWTANVVDRISYEIGSLDNVSPPAPGLPAHLNNPAFKNQQPYNSRDGFDRTDLIRLAYYLDDGGAEYKVANDPDTDETREIITEYAVDLRLTPFTRAPGAAIVPQPGATAQQIQMVRVELGVRSRGADSLLGLANDFRFLLRAAPPAGGRSHFARIRWMKSDIVLKNQSNLPWP